MDTVMNLRRWGFAPSLWCVLSMGATGCDSAADPGLSQLQANRSPQLPDVSGSPPPADTHQDDTAEPAACAEDIDCAAGVAGRPCEIATCLEGLCATAARPDGQPCDDGLDCTLETQCLQGHCRGEVAPKCDDDNPCTADVCGANGCENPPVGGSCDDGDACTQGDLCREGACVATAQTDCADGDGCTLDSCAPTTGDCVHLPDPSCGPVQCNGPEGSGCDDGLAETAGDLCVGGVCVGFERYEFSPVVGESTRFTHLHQQGGRWTAAMAIGGAADGKSGALVSVSLSPPVSGALVAVLPGTRQFSPFSALYGDFAADSGGSLWRYNTVTGTFSAANGFNTALAQSLTGRPRGLWTFDTPLDGGVGHRIWLVGDDGLGGSWLRRCSNVGAIGDEIVEITPVCRGQSLLVQDSPSVRAIAGSTDCDGDGCYLDIVAGADLFETTDEEGVSRWFNDIYTNSGVVGAPWQVALLDPGASRNVTNDIAVLDTGTYLAVGGFEYMRTNSAFGGWSTVLVVDDASSVVHFEGAWSGAGLVAVVGWRQTPDGRRLELWTAESDAELDEPESWFRQVLATSQGEDTGLFDVYGDEAGNIVVVGGIRGSADAATSAVAWVRRAP